VQKNIRDISVIDQIEGVNSRPSSNWFKSRDDDSSDEENS